MQVTRSSRASEMKDDYFAFGINQETALVSVREPFELSSAEYQELVDRMRNRVESEWMLLATCNRTEVYGYGGPRDVDLLRTGMVEVVGTPWPESVAFDMRGSDVVRHVIEVASGLRSQVLGDSQILNQFKEAYRIANEASTVGTVFHRLVHTALNASKRIAKETSVAIGNPSIASLATRVARKRVSEMREASRERPASALVIGAGEMGTQITKILHYDPAVRIALANRSIDKLQSFARQYKATPVPWEERVRASKDADVIFVATSSREYVLCAEEMPDRGERPVFVVDIAVPRNVDPALGGRRGYKLIDIDGLEEINREQREQQEMGLAEALAICEEAAASMVDWQSQQMILRPVAEALAEAFESVREQEVSRNMHRFDPQDHEQLDALTRSIMQKLLAIPLVKLKSETASEEDLRLRVATLASLFAREGCEE